MYQQGQARRTHLDSLMNPESIPSASDQLLVVSTNAGAPVRVITFDLDNTLWNTGATIGTANDALSDFLKEHNIQQPRRTEKLMGDLFQAHKAKYCPLALKEELGSVKAPVLLTQLRKDALHQILREDNGYSEEEAVQFADRAFDKWMEARYQAIPSHYASNVLEVLERISNLKKASSSSPLVLVGAITDGNSDPRNVPELESHFDFCINAEQVGVAKPDARVYTTAIQYVRQQCPELLDMTGDNDDNNTVGPWWIHIGDDFQKDIVAAKNLNMRTIWTRELILGKLLASQVKAKKAETIAAQYNSDEDDENKNDKQPQSPEKELLDFQQKINSQSVVKMAVGAEDYLVQSIQQEFADAILDRLDDLPNLLQQWHANSLQKTKQPTSTELPFVPEEADLVHASVAEQSTERQAEKAPTPASRTEQQVADVYVPEEADLVQDLVQKKQKEATETKFCVFCGAKIPLVAVYCSSCSAKQPQLQ